MSSHTASIEEDALLDVRWKCRCGRFIAESAIEEENYRAPDAYYGVGTRSRYHCPRCGQVDGLPALAVVGTLREPTKDDVGTRPEGSATPGAQHQKPAQVEGKSVREEL